MDSQLPMPARIDFQPPWKKPCGVDMKMNKSDSTTEQWTITSMPRPVMLRLTNWLVSVASI
jgi:hypothetical protein